MSHLIGNLLILAPDGGVHFNTYAKGLADLGKILYGVETGLVLVFVAHIVNGIALKLGNNQARGTGYRMWKSKGGESKANRSSMSMAITGLVLMFFLVYHLWHFKYGPGISQGYVTTIHGEETRDLRRWVVESFQNPWVTLIYSVVMVGLALHVRHGFWSMWQSLSLINPRISPVLSVIGVVLAILLAIGFVGIAVLIYFDPMSLYHGANS